MKYRFLIILACCAAALSAPAADKTPAPPVAVTHGILGLFSPDRADDLREAAKDIAGVKLQSVDYDHARATFVYDGTKAVATRLDQALRLTGFELRPTGAIAPPEKLELIEIPVVGLDCKGCAYGAYLAVNKLDGVERAKVSFKEGRVTALVDPAKIKRADLEAALKKKQVTLATKGAPAK